MPLHLDHPLPALLALAILVAAVILTHRHAASARWRITGILLPLTAAALIALAIARPHLLLARGPSRHIVILLDLSASTRTSPWRDPLWLRNLAEKRLGSDARITLVAFAEQARPLLESVPVSDSQRWPSQWLPRDLDALGNSGASNLEAALAWRAPIENSDPLLPRWLITDGLLTICPNSNLAITSVPPPSIDVAIRDLLLRPLAAPTTSIGNGQSAIGNPLELLAQLAATGPTDAALDILRDGTPIVHQSVTFAGPSTRWLTINDNPPDTPRHRYEIHIRTLPTPDPWPENDHAAILYTPPGPPRILTITNTPSSIGNRQWAMGNPLAPAQFLQTPSQLSEAAIQALILDDIPAEQLAPSDPPALSAQAAQSLDRFIRQTGAGLLILGGSHSFGPGHYADGSPAGDILEQLSPLASRPPRTPNFHLIFLLDASGSMAEPAPGGAVTKFKLLAQAISQAAALLPDATHFTVLTFSNTAQQLADGPVAIPALTQALAGVQPTGPTAPDSALEALAKSLAADPPDARRALIFLTDGEIPALDLPRWTSLLTSSARPVPLTIIAPAASDTSPLRKLAAAVPDSLWLTAADPNQWSPILRQAVARQVSGRLMDQPLDWSAPSLSISGATRRWTETWLKPDANLIASSPGTAIPGQPLAAIAQRGLGKVAALAMPDDSDSARRLTDALLRQIAAAAGDRRFALAAAHNSAGGWRITADGLDNGAFLNHEPLSARILSADADTTLPLLQTAPGHYETRTTAAAPFTVIVSRTSQPQDQLVGRLQTPDVHTAEYPASLDPPPLPATITRLSADLADATRWSPPPATADIALAIPLWLAAALTCLVALHLRRRG